MIPLSGCRRPRGKLPSKGLEDCRLPDVSTKHLEILGGDGSTTLIYSPRRARLGGSRASEVEYQRGGSGNDRRVFPRGKNSASTKAGRGWEKQLKSKRC